MRWYLDRALIGLVLLVAPCSVPPALGQTCTPAPSGLLYWWPLDEFSGPTAFDVASGNDGAHINGPAPVSMGKVAAALEFDGTDDHTLASDPNTPSLLDKTLDAWIKPDVTTPGRRMDIVGLDIIHVLSLFGDEVVYTDQCQPTSYSYLTSSANLQPGVWTHIAATADSAAQEVLIYVNGAQVDGPFPYQDTSCITATDWYIGSSGFTLGFFDGLIDEVEVFDRVLSASEIQAIVAAGPAGKCKTCTPPFLPIAPFDRLAKLNESISIGSGATGSSPLSFEWRRNGTVLTDGGSISGATTDTLTISTVRFLDQGFYEVTVANACGSASQAVIYLTVEGQVPMLDERALMLLAAIAASTGFLLIRRRGTARPAR